MKSLFRRNKGIGLIEILITMGVLAVGILGVAGLNSVISRQSQDNKARAEALAIAQTRIEQVRNYTDFADTLALFDTLYTSTANFVDAANPDNGTNAVFTRSERITDSGDSKIFDVVVRWTDADGVTQNVTLNTELSYVSPRSIGYMASGAMPPTVSGPTGRARLGEGTLAGDPDDYLNDNGDGTKTYQEGDDLKLAVGTQIVLTLALACQTDDGMCIDFVKIKGRVYIDTASSTRQPNEISLIASDAAYCARHYTVAGVTTPVSPTTTKTQTPQTATGNYEYFDYTCYLGGGWHGNVGVVLAGGIAQKDKVCIGDPITSVVRNKPTIAVRRAYRGLIYKPSELQTDGNGNLLPPWKFYSQGIADGVSLPYQSGHGHDFIIGEMAPAKNAGTDCYPTSGASLLTRADSYVSSLKGALFAGMPSGFVCLNDFPNYLDTYTNEYDNDDSCPFDPTNPPSTRYIISGDITFSGTHDLTNDAFVDSINIVTSDGEGNCLVTDFDSNYAATYVCDVYDWANDLTTGWNGYVKPIYSAGMTCTPNPLNFTNVTADDSAGNDFACAPGAPFVWTITVDGGNPDKKINTATMTGIGGSCAPASSGLNYICTSNPFSGTWSGTIVFTAQGGNLICAVPKANSSNSLTVTPSTANSNIALKIVASNKIGDCP